MLANSDLKAAIKDKCMANAFYMLSYMKKLCLHPHLLSNTHLEAKRTLGMITEEEEVVLNETERLRAE